MSPSEAIVNHQLISCVKENSNTPYDLKLKLIPNDEIPRRYIVRIWLLKVSTDIAMAKTDYTLIIHNEKFKVI